MTRQSAIAKLRRYVAQISKQAEKERQSRQTELQTLMAIRKAAQRIDLTETEMAELMPQLQSASSPKIVSPPTGKTPSVQSLKVQTPAWKVTGSGSFIVIPADMKRHINFLIRCWRGSVVQLRYRTVMLGNDDDEDDFGPDYENGLQDFIERNSADPDNDFDVNIISRGLAILRGWARRKEVLRITLMNRTLEIAAAQIAWEREIYKFLKSRCGRTINPGSCPGCMQSASSFRRIVMWLDAL